MGTSSIFEQRNLLGGSDVVARIGRGRRQKTVSLRVDRYKTGFAAALALVVEHGKRAKSLEEVPSRSQCPRCQRVGLTDEHFGTRVIRGKRVRQSWCRECRSARLDTKDTGEGWLFPNLM